MIEAVMRKEFISVMVLGITVLIGPPEGLSQVTFEWEELPETPYVGRHNDVFFTSPETGWIVHGDGEIYKTEDAGQSWQLQYRNLNAHFRSVGFLNDQHGFAGNVGPGEFGAVEATPIFETTDGGQIWLPATGFSDGLPTGICGMQVVNDSTVVAVGRVRGPAFFVRTTDAGDNWTTVDMSEYAAGLIDVFFTHPDSGFAVGLTNANHDQSSGVILRTVDGGNSWDEAFTTTRVGEWFWKMSFPTRQTGYASLQRNSQSPIYFVKTTDGGATWEEKLFMSDYYFVQGLGFIDENTGWIGGNSSSPVYVTTDGGESWQPDEIRPRINRIRFLGDSLGYAVGRSAYKIVKQVPTSIDRPTTSDLYSVDVFPNPSSGNVSIQVDGSDRVEDIYIVDATGRRVVTLDATRNDHLIEWDGLDQTNTAVANGVYFVIIQFDGHRESRGLIRFKSPNR